MNKLRRGKQYGSSKKGDSIFQTAEFRLGYLYRDIKAQLNTLGAETSGEITPLDAARWVGRLLLAEAGGGLLDGTQHLSEMWGHSSEGDEVGPGKAEVHVRPRDFETLKPKRVLSMKARRSIAKAQRKRWRLAKAEARAEAKKTSKNNHTSWAKFTTPEARSAEAKRRRKVRMAKKRAALRAVAKAA